MERKCEARRFGRDREEWRNARACLRVRVVLCEWGRVKLEARPLSRNCENLSISESLYRRTDDGCAIGNLVPEMQRVEVSHSKADLSEEFDRSVVHMCELKVHQATLAESRYMSLRSGQLTAIRKRRSQLLTQCIGTKRWQQQNVCGGS